MRTWFSLALIAILLVVALAGCSGGPSNTDLANKIKSHDSTLISVQVTERLQVFGDSFRSPGDAGTTYIVQVRVTTVHGLAEDRVYRIFIAKSDGWVNVMQESGW